MRAPKFNFITEKQLMEGFSEYTPARASIRVVSWNGAFNTNLVLLRETVDIYGLEGKIVRLYGDRQNRTIGWSVLEEVMPLDELEGTRTMKRNSTNGEISMGIGKLLKTLGIKLTETLSNLEVKKYVSPMHAHEIYYIEIPAQEIKGQPKPTVDELLPDTEGELKDALSRIGTNV